MVSPVSGRNDAAPVVWSVCLIGAPTDAGAGVRGARMGPDALRVAGLAGALRAQGCQVLDAGNLLGPPPSDRLPASAGPRADAGSHRQGEVVAWNRVVFEAVTATLDRGEFPLLMGGDHSLALGSISAVAAHCRREGRQLRVLWLDAHADANTEATSPSGNLHGMPVACLLGRGLASLVGWGGVPAALQVQDLTLIGVRNLDTQEKLLIRQLGLEVYDMRYVDEHGMRATMAQALQGLDTDAHLHLSFDVDVLDPRDAPGVGTPEPGGPTYREMQLCMEMVADTGRLGSLDLMELNPARDLRNCSAEVVVALVRSLFGASTLLRGQVLPERPGP
jgi:arginase